MHQRIFIDCPTIATTHLFRVRSGLKLQQRRQHEPKKLSPRPDDQRLLSLILGAGESGGTQIPGLAEAETKGVIDNAGAREKRIGGNADPAREETRMAVRVHAGMRYGRRSKLRADWQTLRDEWEVASGLARLERYSYAVEYRRIAAVRLQYYTALSLHRMETALDTIPKDRCAITGWGPIRTQLVHFALTTPGRRMAFTALAVLEGEGLTVIRLRETVGRRGLQRESPSDACHVRAVNARVV